MTRFVESKIVFPYKRSLGPVIGAFMNALTEQRILGHPLGRPGDRPAARVGPADRGRARRRRAWSRSARPARSRRGRGCRTRPSSTRSTTRSRSRTSGSTARRRRCSTRWTPARPTRCALGAPGRAALAGDADRPHHRHRRVRARRDARGRGRRRRAGRRAGDDDGLQRVDHATGTRCRWSRTGSGRRARTSGSSASGARSARGSTPAVAATARSTRSSSPRRTTSTCPHTGTITNYTIITPVQYPGQTETEPFARVFVLLDGFDVVLPYQAVIELPVERGAASASGSPRRGRRRTRTWTTPARWAARSATSWAGCRAANPTSTTPTS